MIGSQLYLNTFTISARKNQFKNPELKQIFFKIPRVEPKNPLKKKKLRAQKPLEP